MFAFFTHGRTNRKSTRSLSHVLDRLVGASEAGTFDIRLGADSLGQEDAEAVRLINEVLNNYKIASEYNLLKYRLANDALGIALWDMDIIDGDPVNPNNTFHWSQEFRAMLGFSGEYDFPNVLHSWSDRLHPEDKQRTLYAFASHLADHTGKTPYDITYRLMLKNGEYRYFRALGTTLRNTSGVPIRVAGALEDIHERIQTQNQLAIMSSIVENSPNFVSYKKIEGDCLYVNPAATTLSGYSKEELLADYLDVLFGKEDADRLRVSIPAMLKVKDVLNYEVEAKRKDGTVGTYQVSSFLVGDDAYANIASDITDAKKLEIERMEALERAERANRVKTAFLSKMSHEIRTPISGVIGLSNLLLTEGLNSKQSEYVRLIQMSGQILLSLINDILDFSEMDADKLDLEPENFDLLEMLEPVIGVHTPRLEEKNIELCTSIESGLPQQLTGDMGRIRQILLHLIANAVKFTENGVVTITVAAEEYRTNQILTRFTIKDTGIGIPPDKLDGLFDAFYQVNDSSTRGHEGIGLGLSIAKKIVEHMQGDIGVESTPGQGSTFWFRIPLDCDPHVINCLRNSEHRCAKSKANACKINDRHSCYAAGQRRLNVGLQPKGIRALVTDDMELVCQFVGDQLADWGMLSNVAMSPYETFEKLVQAAKEQQPYSLVVLGQGSKEKDNYVVGKDLIRQIRDTPETKDTAIILMQPLTAELDQEFLTEYSVEFVRKPIFASDLFDAVMNQLFHHHVTESDEHVPTMFDFARSESNTIKIGSKIEEEPIHVLVAEDARINQIVIQNVLQKAKMTYEVANNGREAFHIATTRRFDAILMDCQMPEMNGYEATVHIRQWEQEQNRQRVPIIALTANAVMGDAEKCLEVGMDAYCTKPVDAKVVIPTIERWHRLSKVKPK